MSGNIFRRVEKKYLLTKEEKDNLFNLIWPYIEEDKYFKSIISNIYFDTVDNDIIINSIDKPIFKEKLRLRSYTVPVDMDSEVFLEIKRKFKGVVGKRKVSLKLKDFYDFYDNRDYEKSQIFEDIRYAFDYYGLVPKIFVGYDRVSYKGKDDEGLRITFDSNLRSRFDNLRLEYEDTGDNYFDCDMYIMEIKTLGAMPFWLVDSLSKLKIYPISFSKVGRIYSSLKEME